MGPDPLLLRVHPLDDRLEEVVVVEEVEEVEVNSIVSTSDKTGHRVLVHLCSRKL